MRSKAKSTVAAGALIIFVGTLFSRLLGLIRENLLVNTFPNRLVTDAYNSAFLVPDQLYYLLAGGALSAAFIPVFSGYLAKDNREDANRTASSIANLMMISIVIGLVLLIIFTPEVVRVVAHGYVPGTHKFNLTVILAREMCVMVLFTALSGLMTGMLQSAQHFLTPVVVWNTYSIGIILGISVFSKLPVPSWTPEFMHWTGSTLGIHGAAFGVVLGAISLAAIQLPVVLKHGFDYSFTVDFAHPGVRKVLVLFPASMIGLALSQINLMTIPQMMGSMLPDGAVTDIRAATRLILLPQGLFAVAVATAAFPRLAQHIALGDMQAFGRIITRGIKVISLLTIPSSVLMIILAEPIVGLLYGGKGFGINDIRVSALILSFFSWGLLGLSLMQLINRAFYSFHDMKTPVYISIGMVVGNLLLSWLFVHFSTMSYSGISLAFSISTTLCTLVLFELLRRKVGEINACSLVKEITKVMAASAVMGAVVYGIAQWLAPVVLAGGHTMTIPPTFPCRWPIPDIAHPIKGGIMPVPGDGRLLFQFAAQIGISMFVGGCVYWGALWLLKVDELQAVTNRFVAKIRRQRA